MKTFCHSGLIHQSFGIAQVWQGCAHEFQCIQHNNPVCEDQERNVGSATYAVCYYSYICVTSESLKTNPPKLPDDDTMKYNDDNGTILDFPHASSETTALAHAGA